MLINHSFFFVDKHVLSIFLKISFWKLITDSAGQLFKKYNAKLSRVMTNPKKEMKYT